MINPAYKDPLEPSTLHYAPQSRSRARHPLLGTGFGAIAGIIAIVIWMMLFSGYSQHENVDVSAYLFPLARVVIDWLYPSQSVPVPLWYGGALLQWILVGVVVDVVRTIRRRNLDGHGFSRPFLSHRKIIRNEDRPS